MDLHERWEEYDDHLYTTIECDDFNDVIELVREIADLAERLQHHPDLLIHAYKNLTITLTSHDSEGVSERDYQLAEAIDELLEERE